MTFPAWNRTDYRVRLVEATLPDPADVRYLPASRLAPLLRTDSGSVYRAVERGELPQAKPYTRYRSVFDVVELRHWQQCLRAQTPGFAQSFTDLATPHVEEHRQPHGRCG